MWAKMAQKQGIGLITILLHWGIAVLVFILFFLGVWMVTLDYSHPWYYRGPWWHKGLGFVLFVFIVYQVFWIFLRAPMVSLLKQGSWQAVLSRMMHFLLLILVYLLVFSGYVIVTGQGQKLTVFDWFSVPSVIHFDDITLQWMGDFHCYGAYGLMGLICLHVLAALKHHFFDKDDVLTNMLVWKGE
jgi:cytochrome b561